MFCRKCGKKIPDDSDFCAYCGERTGTAEQDFKPSQGDKISLEKAPQADDKKSESVEKKIVLEKEGETETNIPQKATAVSVNTQVPKKRPVSNIQRKSSKCDICGETVCSDQKTCHNCGAVNRSYNPAFDTGNYDLFRIPGASDVQRKTCRCENCGKTIYSDQKKCHICGAKNSSYTPLPKTKTYRPVNANANKTTYSEDDYDYFKQVSSIVTYCILGAVFLILLISGMFSCSGPGEVSGTVGSWWIWIIIVVAAAVIRWIVLIVYKISHK